MQVLSIGAIVYEAYLAVEKCLPRIDLISQSHFTSITVDDDLTRLQEMANRLAYGSPDDAA